MVAHLYTVLWDKQAVTQLSEIYFYIEKDSYQNAQSVRRKIMELTAGLEKDPRRYNADKLRLDKNPDFRAFEVKNIRVSFYVNEQNRTVNIIRIRNIRQKPFEH